MIGEDGEGNVGDLDWQDCERCQNYRPDKGGCVPLDDVGESILHFDTSLDIVTCDAFIANGCREFPAASDGKLNGVVGGSVVLAYYHTGFQDDPPELLDVCESEAAAHEVIEMHKRDRNCECEYEDKAIWWMNVRTVRTANREIDVHTPEKR